MLGLGHNNGKYTSSVGFKYNKRKIGLTEKNM